MSSSPTTPAIYGEEKKKKKKEKKKMSALKDQAVAANEAMSKEGAVSPFHESLPRECCAVWWAGSPLVQYEFAIRSAHIRELQEEDSAKHASQTVTA